METRPQVENVLDDGCKVNQSLVRGKYGTQAERYWAVLRESPSTTLHAAYNLTPLGMPSRACVMRVPGSGNGRRVASMFDSKGDDMNGRRALSVAFVGLVTVWGFQTKGDARLRRSRSCRYPSPGCRRS